jgi:hypothetical protein
MQAYSGITPAAPASGTVLAQGYLLPRPQGLEAVALPGFLGISGSAATPTADITSILGIFDESAVEPIASVARGCTMKVKGFVKARAKAKFSAAHELFAIGMVGRTTNSLFYAGGFGNSTEGTRDDRATVALIIDGTDNVKVYNCEAAGDASYADPTPGATTKDLLTGFLFEIIIVAPAAGNTLDDLTVTIKVDGTTMISAAPVSVAAIGPMLALLLNCDAEVSQLVYQVTKT